MTGVIFAAVGAIPHFGATEIVLALIAAIGGGGGILTTILQYRAGNRESRRSTEDKLWQRLVTERERVEAERDQAERERDQAKKALHAEQIYVHVLQAAMMAAGLAVPPRPDTT